MASETIAAPAGAGSGPRYRVEAISRAAQILECLDSGPGENTVAIAARAQTTEAFAASALATLERGGLVRRGGQDGGEWSLGLAWLRLAAAGRRQLDLREIAAPIMRRMRDDVDETIILSVPRDKKRVNIEFMESTQSVRRLTQIGYESPLYVGAAGRALLSGFSARDLRDYLASVAAADGMVISGLDVEAYAREVEAVAARGRAVTEREFSSDICAVAAPVRDHAGRVVAALTISCPADRFTPGLEEACVRTAVSGAADVSRLIGYSAA